MRSIRASMMAGLTTIVAVCSLAAAAGPVATTTTLRDDPSDAVRSDGAGGYIHGTDCVASTRDSRTGSTALRTASHTVCSDTYWQNGGPVLRQLVVDFSHPVGSPPSQCQIDDLNACGGNVIPDGRPETTDAFSSQALSRGTGLAMYLSFHPNLNNTEFYLEYEQPVGVDGTSSERTLTAGTNAVAELYKVSRVKNRLVLTSVGRYYMPLQMTIN